MRQRNAGATVDVLIIGGGVQGLVILDALTQAGYAPALVTEAELGAGQTLHSHGFLNSGFGMAGPAPAIAAQQIVHPFLRERGVELRDNWVILPPPGDPGIPALAGLPRATLPAGFAPACNENARKLPDCSFNKRRLVEALSKGREDRIIRGAVTGFEGRAPVEAALVRPAGSEATLTIRATAFVVAAGCGAKRLLRDLVGPTAQLDLIKPRVVHMVCLRAPRGALPATSVAALPLELMLAAHEDGDSVTWYVTPMEINAPAFEAAPNDAAAPTAPATLARAAEALLALYPSLPATPGLRVGHYAGYRQDIGDERGGRLCAPVDGASNVIVALPGGLIAPWQNAAETLALLRGLTAPGGGAPARLPGGGDDVRVGQAVEDRPGFTWQTWQEWRAALPHAVAPA
jgi:hypothetical protein